MLESISCWRISPSMQAIAFHQLSFTKRQVDSVELEKIFRLRFA